VKFKEITESEIQYSKEVNNDAGRLREYVVQKFGSVLKNGGEGSKYLEAIRRIKRLCVLLKREPTEKNIEAIRKDIVKDFDASED
jgi:hypothetical protein